MSNNTTERFLRNEKDTDRRRGKLEVIMGRKKQTRTSIKYNPRSVRATLENRDFLSKLCEQEAQAYIKAIKTRHGIDLRERDLSEATIAEIRKNTTFIYIVGTKDAGKSELCDDLWKELGKEGYTTLATRASKAANPADTEARRNALRRQKRGEVDWTSATNALREEAVSALEKEVYPFLLRYSGTKRVVIFNRYPLIDTLVKQYLEGAHLQAVAQYLRGRDLKQGISRKIELSGYIKPDIVILLACDPQEALSREILRNKHERDSRSEELGVNSDFIADTSREIKTYKLLSGYQDSGDRADPNQRVYPTKTFYYADTSNDSINYSNPEEARKALEQDGRERTDHILRNVVLPYINATNGSGKSSFQAIGK